MHRKHRKCLIAQIEKTQHTEVYKSAGVESGSWTELRAQLIYFDQTN